MLRRIGLFGSYAKGTHTEDSDIDIIVEFETPLGFKFMDFADYREELLGKPVDVLTLGGLQGIRNSTCCPINQGKYCLCPIEPIPRVCLSPRVV